MDIIYKLPLPDEICSKIIVFAYKTPHTGLAVKVLKKKLCKPMTDQQPSTKSYDTQ